MSDVRASFNESMVFNETYHVPSLRTSLGSTNEYSLTIAFINFSAALLAITVRYSSVFWYTNKIITCVFAVQLLIMSITCIFGFCGFAVLYKVCYNNPLYHKINFSLSCPAIVTFYLIGGFVVLVSTVTVFEYGSLYFHQKFKIVDRNHNPETYVKQTVIVHSGCRGYIPHTCATVALITMAICKGPIVFELVTVYRMSNDNLVLMCVVLEVCYMLFWITFWCGLTVKQQWKFKILDYVPLKKPVFMIGRESVVQNPTFDSKRLELEMLNVPRSRSPLPSYDGILVETREPCPSEDDITESSDTQNFNETNSTDLESIQNGGARKKTSRKNGARVTFQDTRNNSISLSVEDRRGRSRSRTPVITEPNHVNIQVDVHTAGQSRNTDDREQNNHTSNVLLRQNSGSTPVSRDYRNSLRDKTSDNNSNINKLSHCSDDGSFSTVSEPLPTLMSSFRDKVKESSRAANNYKEQRNMLESSGSFGNDSSKPNCDSLKRRAKILDTQGDSYLKVNLDNLDFKNHICDSPLRAGVTDGPMRQNSTSGYSDDSGKCSTFKTTPDLSPLSNSPINCGISPETMNGNNKLTNGRLDYNTGTDKDYLFPRPVHLLTKKPEIGRRDSANYSLTSSQDTSSNDSDHGQGGLCSQMARLRDPTLTSNPLYDPIVVKGAFNYSSSSSSSSTPSH